MSHVRGTLLHLHNLSPSPLAQNPPLRQYEQRKHSVSSLILFAFLSRNPYLLTEKRLGHRTRVSFNTVPRRNMSLKSYFAIYVRDISPPPQKKKRKRPSSKCPVVCARFYKKKTQTYPLTLTESLPISKFQFLQEKTSSGTVHYCIFSFKKAPTNEHNRKKNVLTYLLHGAESLLRS